MERIGIDPAVQQMAAKWRAVGDALATAKEDRMAALPEGTCRKCEGAGSYMSYDHMTYRCEACQVMRPVVTAADGVPYEFREVNLDAYDARDGQQTAVRSASGTNSDLYVYGGVGAGKTRLAAAIVNSHVSQRKTGYFARVPMLLYQLQRTSDESAELERRILTASLVVFDDIGAERDAATDYTRRTLLMLYEGRCDAGLRSVFTSNKSLSELSQQQDDDRLASRLAGRCVVVQMKTPDQRLRRVK